ncbi:hypothetical protein SRABI106_04289 [Rahnella aquatilis]|nr:hypothetical protein SRABI106_04289 [Rahnella aquatilis]
MQHARLRCLRRDVEEYRTGKVQPGIRHQFRFIQQGSDRAEHRIGERAVVIVIRKLFGTATEVADKIAVGIFAARPGLSLPDIRITFAVIAAFLPFFPAHFSQIDQPLTPFGFRAPALVAAGFLCEVCKHGGKAFTANGIRITSVGIRSAHGRELADGLQEFGVGIARVTQRENVFPLITAQNAVHPLHVSRVIAAAGSDFIDGSIIQCADRRLNLLHQRVLSQAVFFFNQITFFDDIGIRRIGCHCRSNTGHQTGECNKIQKVFIFSSAHKDNLI